MCCGQAHSVLLHGSWIMTSSPRQATDTSISHPLSRSQELYSSFWPSRNSLATQSSVTVSHKMQLIPEEACLTPWRGWLCPDRSRKTLKETSLAGFQFCQQETWCSPHKSPKHRTRKKNQICWTREALKWVMPKEIRELSPWSVSLSASLSPYPLCLSLSLSPAFSLEIVSTYISLAFLELTMLELNVFATMLGVSLHLSALKMSP